MQRLIPVLLAGLALGATPARGQTLEDARQLHMDGDLRGALAAFLEIAERSAEGDPAAAATAFNNACVILNGFAEYERARAACIEALDLRRQLDDERRLARTLNNLAIAQQNLGDYAEARRSFEDALALNDALDDVQAQVLNLSNLGALAILAGNFGKALEFHEAAIEIATRHEPEAWATDQLWIAEANRGVVLERLGAFRQALEIYRRLAEEPVAAADPRRRAQLKLNMGVIYRNLGDPVRAVREFEEVATIYRRLDDPDGLSNALLNTGLVLHLNLGRWEEAEAAYRDALALAVRHQNRPEEIQDLYYLGHFLLERHRYGEAKEMLERCLTAAEDSGSAEGRWSALAGLGRLSAARGDLRAALEYLERAVAEIEGVGSTVPTGSLLAGFFGSTAPVYAAAVRVLHQLHQREPGADHHQRALEIAQQAKNRALLDALGTREGTAAPLSASELLRESENDLIIEYFDASGDLFRWILGRHQLRFDYLGPTAPLRNDIKELLRALADDELPELTTLERIARTILSGADLPSSTKPNELRIAADGVLHRLPFELLPLPGSQDTLLIDRFTLSSVPSASTLIWLRRRSANRRGDGAVAVRAVINPTVTDQPGDVTTPSSLLVARYGLRPLQATDVEIDALARYLPAPQEILTGSEATESALKRRTSPARVLHLAAHAVVDDRPGRGAAILLQADTHDDGLLYPREIASLDLVARLTVLAACRTTLEAIEGGALSTLAGAFLGAGSSAVVATLWDVGDHATAAFMSQFYYQLGQGLSPAEALRGAKQRLRADTRWRHPSLWAAYVLIGEGQPLPQQRPGWLPWILAGTLGIALALFWWRRRARTPE